MSTTKLPYLHHVLQSLQQFYESGSIVLAILLMQTLGPGRLNNLPEVAELVSGKAGFWIPGSTWDGRQGVEFTTQQLFPSRASLLGVKAVPSARAHT